MYTGNYKCHKDKTAGNLWYSCKEKIHADRCVSQITLQGRPGHLPSAGSVVGECLQVQGIQSTAAAEGSPTFRHLTSYNKVGGWWQEATLRAILSPEPPLGSLSLIRPAGGSAFFSAQSRIWPFQPQHMTPDTHLAPQTPSLCLPLENPAHNKDFLCY